MRSNAWSAGRGVWLARACLTLITTSVFSVLGQSVPGVVWALWHAPAFVTKALFSASRGSVSIAILYHLNIMNPILPHAQPWDSYLFAITAVTMVPATLSQQRTDFNKKNDLPNFGGGS